jgi:hypothetical protein
MKNENFQFILKLIDAGVVSVSPCGNHTSLTVNDSQFVVKYFPSDNDHDFIVHTIDIITDYDGTVGCTVNIIGVQEGYYKHGTSFTELKSQNFFIFKLTSI